MPIVNSKGEKISEKDLAALIKMMKGSLESRASYIEGIKKINYSENLDEDPKGNLSVKAVKECRNAAKSVESRYKNLYDGEEIVKVDDLLKVEFENVDKRIFAGRVYDIEKDPYTYCFIDILWDVRKGPNKFMLEFQDFKYNVDLKKIYSDAGYEDLKEGFQLPDKPIDGIEDIVEFDSRKDSVNSLGEGRRGNSDSLRQNEGKLRAEKKLAEQNGKYFDKKEQLNKAMYAEFGFNSSAEVVKQNAVKMKESDKITVSDLFDTFSEINECVRLGQSEGGKIRGDAVDFDGKNTVPPDYAVCVLYKALEDIAENINKIKQTKDLALQKTQALQLASFTYQVAISIHPFEDGNGRSCRLFADAILQTFGLPPHIPDEREQHLSNGYGKPLDFEAGKNLIYEGVKKSSALIVEDRKNKEKLVQETKAADEKNLAAENEIYEATLDEVSIDKVSELQQLLMKAHSVRGTFHNSKQYDAFEATLKAKYVLTNLVNDAKVIEADSIGLDNLPANIREIAIIAARASKNTKTIRLEECGKMLTNLDRSLTNTAKHYIEYKFSTRTDDVAAEPGKQPLNSDDIAKLNLIKDVLPDGKYDELRNNYKNHELNQIKEQNENVKNVDNNVIQNNLNF